MARIFRFWHRWRDFIQVGGYFIMLGTILTGVYTGICFIQTANATADAVLKLQDFKEETNITLAMQKEDMQNIKGQLNRMENVQGKIFERINQIADQRHDR